MSQADAGRDVILAAFFAALLFITAYTVVAPWWRTPIGRTLVVMDAGIAGTLLAAVLHYLSGIPVRTAAWGWVEVSSIGLVAAATLWRTVVMVRVQWRERQRP